MAARGAWHFEPPPENDEILVEDRNFDAVPDGSEQQQLDHDEDEGMETTTQFLSAQHEQRPPSYAHLEHHQPHSKARFLPSEPREILSSSTPKPTSAVGQDFECIFPYKSFNPMQSECFDLLFKSGSNVVVTSPTGSGKTVLFELALCRLFASRTASHGGASRKALYLAPLKALVNQRFLDWRDKFQPLGITCGEVSGDQEDFGDIPNADIIVATAEKWDSITRKLSRQALMSHISLVLIDEVHVLNEDRGAVLEAVVSRMMLQTQVERRYIALSATIPNLEGSPTENARISVACSDIGEWLKASPESMLRFESKYRPVQLTQHVLSYPASKNGFLFDRNLNWRLPEVVTSHDEGKPSLVFCTSRKECEHAATALIKNPISPRGARQPFVRSNEARAQLIAASRKVIDKSLQELLTNGVGVYHAGLDFADRRLVEQLFIARALSVVCTTSSLAQGVNLPAHLVVVKSTQSYRPGVGYQEYTDLTVLQMIGRAGRPQFDDSGVAVIMTSADQRQKWERLLAGRELVESNLHKSIVEHITAEICRGTIHSTQDVIDWIHSTFLYVRMRKEPSRYGLPSGAGLEKEVHRLCEEYVVALLDAGMISNTNNTKQLHAEPMGFCMTKYYLRFNTFAQFKDVTAESTLIDLVTIVAHADEFTSIVLRRSEKAALNAANKHTDMRFPQKGPVKNVPSKVVVLLQAALCGIPIKDFSLQQDTNVIFACGVRISRALLEYLLWKQVGEAPLLAGVDLLRVMQNRIWENSSHVVRQVEKIGPVMSAALVSSGITSFDKLEVTDPRVIEGLVNRHAPFGTEVLSHVRRIPKFGLTVTNSKLQVTVSIKRLTAEPPAKMHRYSVLVLAASDGRLLKTSHEQQEVHCAVPLRDLPSAELSVHLLSEEVFGRDVRLTHHLTGPVHISYAPPRSAPMQASNARKRKADTTNVSTAANDGNAMQAFTQQTQTQAKKKSGPGSNTSAVTVAVAAPALVSPEATLKDTPRYDAVVVPSIKCLRPAPSRGGSLAQLPSRNHAKSTPRYVQHGIDATGPPSRKVFASATPAPVNHIRDSAVTVPESVPATHNKPIVDLSAVFADLF